MYPLFAVVNKNRIYLYKHLESRYIVQSINGNLYYEFHEKNITNNVDSLLKLLCDEYNLESSEGLTIDILESNSSKNTSVILSTISKQASAKRINLESTMLKILMKLQKNDQLMVGLYGINYEGVNYLLENKNIKTSEFNLLAYSLEVEELIKYLD